LIFIQLCASILVMQISRAGQTAAD